MGFRHQLRLLLWKNFTLRKRQPVRVVIEIVWPLCLFLILVGVRTREDLKEFVPQCHYDGRAMPSAGVLPFLQSYMCTLNNTCHATVTADEMAGQVDNFNSSQLTQLVSDIERVLANNTDQQELLNLIDDFNLLQNMGAIIQNGSSVGTITVGNLLVDPERLRSTALNQSLGLTNDSLNLLLNANLSLSQFVTNGSLDAAKLISLFGNLTSSVNSMNATVEQLREEVCQENYLTRWLSFTNDTAVNMLHGQLCNLTLNQSLELLQDFRDELDPVHILSEVNNYISANTGMTLKANNASVQRLSNIFRDLQALSSLSQVFSDIQAVAADMANASIAAGNSTNAMQTISQLFCGRGMQAFTIPQEEDDGFGKFSIQGTQGTSSNREDELQGVTQFCQDFFAPLENSVATRVLWRQLKPIVLGSILYTPDTPAIRRIIAEANQTFATLADLITVASQWAVETEALENFLESDPRVEAIRTFVNSAACPVLLTGRVPQGVDPTQLCANLARYLDNGGSDSQYDWRDSLNHTKNLLNQVQQYLQCFKYDKFRGYDNENDLVRDGLNLIENNTFWAALVFDVKPTTDNSSDLQPHITYKIRMDTAKVDSTKKIKDKYWKPGARDNPLIDLKYLTYGFAFLQDMVDHAIIRLQTGQTEEVGVFVQQFPYPCYIRDKFIMAISRTMPMFMVIAWIYSVAMIVKGIVFEKEERLKEVMKIMGLGNAVHWVAWFINAIVMMTITVILLVMVLKGGKVLEHSDPSVIFVFLMAFTVSTIMQCFLISVLFSKANLAAVCGGFIYFVLYLPYTQVVQWEDQLNNAAKFAVCLSSNVAFGFGCSYFSRYEETTEGMQWSNIARSPVTDDEFNMLSCIFMMLIDAVIYGILTWYIEAVFPGEYGIPRRWYFPIQKSYWCGTNVKSNSYAPSSISVEMQKSDEMEEEPKDKVKGVSIHNLRKRYKTGNKVAVDGLTLNFFEDQITSFLGHNGAGKTTTMSILTGLFPPTEGTAYVYGEDIRTNMDSIRKSLGMCPQHNVLFDLLSVEEHIWFYGRLKGCSESEVQREIPVMIKDVGLPHKKKELSKNLSGGMKRKLSVAVAFVGGSRTVILDEPTAGVDPYARRAIWELLLKYKKGRTIILSTHHMDEADVLGDRIAIISLGKLRCCGSSLFLKNRYGNGYYLTLVRSEAEDTFENGPSRPNSALDVKRPATSQSIRSVVDVKPAFGEQVDEGFHDNSESTSNSSDTPLPFPAGAAMVPGFSVERLTALIQKFVPEARLVEDNTTELCFQLPDEAAQAGMFQPLFDELEHSHGSLGISSFGISDTSLEEVFLKVADEGGSEETDEATFRQVETYQQGGKYPAPVTRLSFRRRLKELNCVKNRTTDEDDLIGDNFDTESTVSAPGNLPDPGHTPRARVTGWNLIRRQFLALFIKRFHHVRRSKKGFVCEVLLPAGFVCLAMVFSMITPPFVEEPALTLHHWHYTPKYGDHHLKMFYSNDNPQDDKANNLENTLLNKPWVGNRCMNPTTYSVPNFPCEQGQTPPSWTARPPLTGNTSLDSPDCDCSSGVMKCPPGAGGPTPSRRLLPSSEYLYNATGHNISDWLVKTDADKLYSQRRFGGLSFGEKNAAAQPNMTMVVDILDRLSRASNNGTQVIFGNETLWNATATFLEGAIKRDIAKVWFYNKGWISSVTYMNILNNLILRSNLPANRDPADYGITVINHPMNYTRKQLSEEAVLSSFTDVIVAICVIFAMSFIPASFVLFLIEERVSNAKHLQFVSGIKPAVYWVATFAWDMLNYLIPAVLCIFIFLAFNQEAYVGRANAGCLVALLFLYGWAIVPMMYPFSRLFSVPSAAFVVLSCGNVFLGMVSTLATFILELLQQEDKELADINDILKQVFLLLPHYCLGRGLIDMTSEQLKADIIAQFGERYSYDLFQWNIVGRNLFSLAMIGIFFFILNLLIEYNFFIKRRDRQPLTEPDDQEDMDVARERRRVNSDGAKDDMLVLKNLSKVYTARGRKGKMTAVNNLCLGVPKGQCFGLLGVNGAGKTTTFKMLTGDIPVTGGSASIGGISILQDMDGVRQLMGYCPQFDALDSLLTGQEHLEFYARVRGIPESEVKQVASWCIRKLNLSRHASKVAGSYSGGNKRKLSTAIALVGNPPIIFLDEPTTGMDPKAKRFLWNCISSIVKSGRSVILTSHSMEECEALCGRLAIMVNGHFKCIGSTQHLKSRFGDGYTVILRVAGERPDMDGVKRFVSETFPGSQLKEQHHNMVQYQLGPQETSLSRLFAKMEDAKKTLAVEDYSVSQTTLDQVFINFAKLQTDLLDDEQLELPADLQAAGFDMLVLDNQGYDAQSLSGSTVGLIRPDSARSSARSYTSQPPDMTDVSIA